MSESVNRVLDMSDSGATVANICKATGLRQGWVYAILREKRPDRPRHLRQRAVKSKRLAIIAFDRDGMDPARIAHVAKVSRAYVYRIIGEESA